MEYKNDLNDRRTEMTEKPCGCTDNCAKECNIYTNVKVPVECVPQANIGKIEVGCCGEPEVTCECTRDCGVRVVLSQSLFVKIPVCYDVKVRTGESHIECKECRM